MHRFLHILLLIALINLSSSTGAGAQAKWSSNRINNAYQAARRWARVDAAAVTDTAGYKLLLGSLIWYADLQDEEGDVYGALFTKLQKYPLLDSIASIVFLNIYPANTIFNADLKPESFSKITDADSKAFLEKNIGQLKKFKEQIDGLFHYDSLLTAYMAIAPEVVRLSGQPQLTGLQNDTLVAPNSAARSVEADFYNTGKSLGLDSNISADNSATLYTRVEKQFDTVTDSIELVKKSINARIAAHPDYFSGFLAGINPSVKTFIKAPGVADVTEAGQKFAAERQEFTVGYLSEVGAPQLALRMPSQSELIDAVAIYLAKRMKQEAVMWFFETISKNARNYELIATFFPNTIKLLRSYEVYEIPNMGAQWQYALSKDFMQMPANVLNSDWLAQRCPAIAPYKSFIRGGTAMAGLLQERYSYREIIGKLYLDTKSHSDSGSQVLSFDKVVGLLYAVNTELFAQDSLKRYRMLKYEDYRGMSAHELELMVSLLDMKYNGIFSGLLAGMERRVQLNATVRAEDIRLLLGKVAQTLGRIETMREQYAREMAAQKEHGNSKDWDYTTDNVWAATSQIWSIFDAEWAGRDIFSTPLNNSRRAFGYMGELYEVYNLVSKKNYAGAVNNTLQLLDSIFYNTNHVGDSRYFYKVISTDSMQQVFGKNELLREVARLVESKAPLSKTALARLDTLRSRYRFEVSAGNVISFEKNSPMAAITFEKDRHAVQQIRKLAAFLNDAALAQSDKQLAKAIESYALPPGSYKRKRNNWYSLDLNAYTGVYGGTEGLFQSKHLPEDFAGVIGFSAPIGLTLSKTFSKRKEDNIGVDYILNPNKLKLGRHRVRYRSKLNMAVTLSIVDLGAVVSYRLSNTMAEALPKEVKWEQLLSPGLHFAIGIPSTPLVGMVGAQFSPKLREINETGKEYNAFRIYGGLYFDLPLLNFWERRRIAY